MTDLLQEYCTSRGVSMRIDRQLGILHGVKVLGLKSRNGRSYLPEALLQAAPLYENAKVNVNHPRGNPGSPRDYQDRIGAIHNVHLREGEGLFADFHYNPKHALAEQLLWDAEHAPENVGFSHNVEARTSRRGEDVVVEAITRVQSVDLVADPATTQGLFESSAARKAAALKALEDLTMDELRQACPQWVEILRQEQAVEIRRLEEEVERLTSLEAAARKETLARRLLREAGLPEPETADASGKPSTDRHFFEWLMTMPDERSMRELIEDRMRWTQTSWTEDLRPRSTDQLSVQGVKPLNGKSFVEAIT